MCRAQDYYIDLKCADFPLTLHGIPLLRCPSQSSLLAARTHTCLSEFSLGGKEAAKNLPSILLFFHLPSLSIVPPPLSPSLSLSLSVFPSSLSAIFMGLAVGVVLHSWKSCVCCGGGGVRLGCRGPVGLGAGMLIVKDCFNKARIADARWVVGAALRACVCLCVCACACELK